MVVVVVMVVVDAVVVVAASDVVETVDVVEAVDVVAVADVVVVVVFAGVVVVMHVACSSPGSRCSLQSIRVLFGTAGASIPAALTRTFLELIWRWLGLH